MPSTVAWRFFVASAEIRRATSQELKKKAMKKSSSKAKKGAKKQQNKVDRRTTSTVQKKPSGKVGVMKVKTSQSPQKIPSPPRTPKRKTKPGDGTTPWSHHYSQ